MNNAYLRKLISDELRETLLFAGLVKDYDCKTRVLGANGKTKHYEFATTFGSCKVVSPKIIYINKEKFGSMTAVKRHLVKYIE